MEQDPVRWGMIGCGDVAEVKSGPAFAKARGSALVAVMRRDRSKAEDFARRHGIPRVHSTAEAADCRSGCRRNLHCDAARQPLRSRVSGCSGPEALSGREADGEELSRMRSDAPGVRNGCRAVVGGVLSARPAAIPDDPRLVASRHTGPDHAVSVDVREPLATGDAARAWRFNPAIAGAGLFFDKGSHCIDILDFLIGPVDDADGMP